MLAAAQSIVVGPVCVFVGLWQRLFVRLWVCYHDNSKLRPSILTKLVFVGKGSVHLQLIKFWLSRAPGKVCAAGRKCLAPPYYS